MLHAASHRPPPGHGVPAGEAGGPALESDAERLLNALRSGDESVFRQLVVRHHAAMVRMAVAYVESRAVAEEVVQETWLAVLDGLDRFEGRSSLKTWIFRILVNRAKTRGVREDHSIPVSAFDHDVGEGDHGPSVDRERFFDQGHRWGGHWSVPPEPWSDVPADQLTGKETLAVVEDTIRRLPVQQRWVITLRDIEGWTSEEVCDLLDLTQGNQRALLHRARSRVRGALERHLAGTETGTT
ncbi:MAG: sigma-70 family RNA polymerase sigma factor [Actinomycetota bacterium]